MATGKLVRMTCRRKRREGFTLLELLVVVGILATLVALALPYYQDYINQSRITAAQTDLTSFSKALALYEQTETTYATDTFLPLIGKYMQDFRTYTGQTNPKDPWGSDYLIKLQSGVVLCCGLNGVDNTANSQTALEDDMLVPYKPPFFVSGARAVNATTIEVIFSRRVLDTSLGGTTALRLAKFTLPAGSTGQSVQRVSETIYRIILTSPMARGNKTISVAAAVTDQNGLAIGTHTNPETGAAGDTKDFVF